MDQRGGGSVPDGDRNGGQFRHKAAFLLRALWEEVSSDHLLMVASGLAYYALLAVLPGLAAAAAIWGLVAGPIAFDRAVGLSEGLLPAEAVTLLQEFVTDVPAGFGFGIGLLVNLGLVFWTAQRSASGLITALNIVFDEPERRSRARRAAAGAVIAVSGILLLLLTLVCLALPPLIGPYLDSRLAGPIAILRWPALAVLFVLSLSLLFSFGPSREASRWQPVSWGAASAAVLWLVVSYGLSLYLANAGSFGRLYGSIGAVIVLLLWFYAGAVAILTGAEIDALSEEWRGRRPRDGLKRALRERERSGTSA